MGSDLPVQIRRSNSKSDGPNLHVGRPIFEKNDRRKPVWISIFILANVAV
jgi:hypothetical protein